MKMFDIDVTCPETKGSIGKYRQGASGVQQQRCFFGIRLSYFVYSDYRPTSSIYVHLIPKNLGWFMHYWIYAILWFQHHPYLTSSIFITMKQSSLRRIVDFETNKKPMLCIIMMHFLFF